ncbi:MAG: nuclear transport factor 2 family protein [Krumholzibacteria bacterium]|nr:nuclear transport factor 2 family protein [Candidatus Krumholzibacteria bacterium]
MPATNKQIVQAYVDAFNHGDLDALVALFAPDALVHGVLGSGGLEVVRPVWGELITCFAINLEIEDLVAEDDRVVARYVERGRSSASFRGGPVTRQPYAVPAMEWFELRDGLIRQRWGARDMAAQFRQMGLPVPG